MNQKFPPGTSLSTVLLEEDVKDGPQTGESADTLAIDLGSEPSTVWYCSRFQSYAVFRFDSAEPAAPLKKLELETRGIDCL